MLSLSKHESAGAREGLAGLSPPLPEGATKVVYGGRVL